MQQFKRINLTYYKKETVAPSSNIDEGLKFGDGDGPILCRVKKVDVSLLLKIYFGLG